MRQMIRHTCCLFTLGRPTKSYRSEGERPSFSLDVFGDRSEGGHPRCLADVVDESVLQQSSMDSPSGSSSSEASAVGGLDGCAGARYSMRTKRIPTMKHMPW